MPDPFLPMRMVRATTAREWTQLFTARIHADGPSHDRKGVEPWLMEASRIVVPAVGERKKEKGADNTVRPPRLKDDSHSDRAYLALELGATKVRCRQVSTMNLGVTLRAIGVEGCPCSRIGSGDGMAPVMTVMAAQTEYHRRLPQ